MLNEESEKNDKWAKEVMIKAISICVFYFVFIGVSLCADEIDGFWKNVNQKTGKPGILVSIYEYEGIHYGRIIASYDKEGMLDDTIYAASSRAAGVKGNPLYSGLDFIWNVKKKGSRYKGKIMDPRKGKTYDVELWVQDGQLVVRGEILFFGRNEIWHPITESDFSASFQKPDPDKFIPVIPEAQ
jgi:uncharacterized protein (DUF2147 family)